MNKKSSGFTFIEILIALSVIAVCFLPLIQMFSVSLQQVYESADLATARYLAQEGMERLKNLGYTQSQIEGIKDFSDTGMNEPVLINGKYWRLEYKIVRGTDPLEIHVLVYRVGKNNQAAKENRPLVELATMVEDLDWSSPGV